MGLEECFANPLVSIRVTSIWYTRTLCGKSAQQACFPFLINFKVDGDVEVLQKAWQVVKGSTIPDVKKNDLAQLLLQTLLERGCPLAQLRIVESSCDVLVKDTLAFLVAADAAAAEAENAMEENGGVPVAKRRKVSSDSAVRPVAAEAVAATVGGDGEGVGSSSFRF